MNDEQAMWTHPGTGNARDPGVASVQPDPEALRGAALDSGAHGFPRTTVEWVRTTPDLNKYYGGTLDGSAH
jgi:hypothetical protein